MEQFPRFTLLDAAGQPLGAELADALLGLVPRLVREYPALRDESLLVGALESAARKISTVQRRLGPIEKLNGYAWQTLQNCAKSQLRLGKARLARKFEHGDSASLSSVPSKTGTPDQIENAILLRQVMQHLTREERFICIKRELGYTSEEIARSRGGTAAAVDTLLSRARQKLRRRFFPKSEGVAGGGGSAGGAPEHRGTGGAKSGDDDDE